MDLNEIFSLGATLMLKFGTYNYNKTYYESDPDNLHNIYYEEPPYSDINNLTVKDELKQELTGVSGILGFQAKINNAFRLGLAVKFPTLISNLEHFHSNYKVIFDTDPNGKIGTSEYFTGNFKQEYSIITPFEFSLGLSGNVMGLSYSLAASYQDASAIYLDYSFENYDFEDIMYLDDLNNAIKEQLGEQLTLGIGLEYKIPTSPFYVRGSYTLITSPYINKDFGSNKSIIGAGFGIVLTNNFILDAAFSYTNYTEQKANYGSLDNPLLFSAYEATYTPTSFMLGFRYRF
jgi:long-subunit fatty acid transport protein